MATYWENSCSFGLRNVLWYKYLIVTLVFSHLGFWSGNLSLIAPFPDLCLLVPFYLRKGQHGKRMIGGVFGTLSSILSSSSFSFLSTFTSAISGAGVSCSLIYQGKTLFKYFKTLSNFYTGPINYSCLHMGLEIMIFK